MRSKEIKLKAWLRNVGIMLNVYVLDQTGDAGRGTHFERSKGYSEHGGQFVFNIDDADLRQFIGLKDKNDNEIYAGDILKHNSVLYVVKFSETQFCFILKDAIQDLRWRDLEWCNRVKKYIEIVGNIYQNPDLVPSKNIV